jgi:hypothetical protein
MSENTKDELLDLMDKLEGRIYQLSGYIEDNELVPHEVWYKSEQLLNAINRTRSRIKEMIYYS